MKARRRPKLTAEQRRAIWGKPESNAGEGWGDLRVVPSLRPEDEDDYERAQRRSEMIG